MGSDSENIVQNFSQNDALDELRQLILGLQPQQLERLQKSLQNKEDLIGEIGNILPEAVLQNIEQNSALGANLLPIIEEAIFASVEKNPSFLANALFPIMGPAIRKSISDTFRKMIDSLNASLESRFSLERLKWRFQSLFSKQSYAEIVLLHGIPFQVKSVFLIHKETGILIQDAHQNTDKQQDSDMISSMLTAVQDFIHDSFANQLESQDSLDSIRLNDFNLWIESGPFAYLAVVFEGHAPEDMRENLKLILEKIHGQHAKLLKDFDGDTSKAHVLMPLVEKCLISKEEAKPKKSKLKIWIAFTLLLLVIVFFTGRSIYRSYQFNHFQIELENIPSVVILKADKSFTAYHILAMKDPSVKLPETLWSSYHMDSLNLEIRWQLYQSLDPQIIIQRIQNYLPENQEVKMQFVNNTLVVSGAGNSAYYFALEQYLKAHQQDFKSDISRLVNTDLQKIDALNTALESEQLFYKTSEDQLTDSQRMVLDKVISSFLEAQELNPDIQLEITVYLDYIGNTIKNRYFAKKRIKNLRKYLISHAINEQYIKFMINETPDNITFRRAFFHLN